MLSLRLLARCPRGVFLGGFFREYVPKMRRPDFRGLTGCEYVPIMGKIGTYSRFPVFAGFDVSMGLRVRFGHGRDRRSGLGGGRPPRTDGRRRSMVGSRRRLAAAYDARRRSLPELNVRR